MGRRIPEEISVLGLSGRLEAVSYTHLDVYKRQLLYCIFLLNLLVLGGQHIEAF